MSGDETLPTDPYQVRSLQHCRRCGAHVAVWQDGTTACECEQGPDLEGPDPGCDWP